MRHVLIALLLTVAVHSVLAQEKTLGASQAWVKAPAVGDTTATAFVVVDNPTMYDVYLVSASTGVAGSVQFQRAPKTSAGKPEPVTALTAPAYGKVELKPDGVYLLLSDLKRALNPGDTVELTLTTDGGVTVTASAAVRKN
jgi:periplasmic copper chaperone A